MFGECFVVGRVVLHVERDDLFSFGRHDFVGFFGERNGFVAAFLVLRGIGRFGDFDFGRLKEPLSILTTRSRLAVIHPIDLFLGHGDFLSDAFGLPS